MTTAEVQAIKARFYGIGWALVSHAQGTDKIEIIPAIRQGFDIRLERTRRDWRGTFFGATRIDLENLGYQPIPDIDAARKRALEIALDERQRTELFREEAARWAVL
jgi:hypothetical protein